MGVRNRDRPVIRRLDSKTLAACFGLAPAGQIVSLHQGGVSAGSPAVGRGSAFVARLPGPLPSKSKTARYVRMRKGMNKVRLDIEKYSS
jgi:hypothetical protein